jgi:phage tail sheath protein FI
LISVPPAADVANVLIRKFTGGDPYMICANNNGILSNVNIAGTEMALDTQDREALEPFGINPIITRNQNTMIYGNQTAYQRMKSDFNKLHIRENLNTIELACDAVLQNYNFLHNTATVRADIVQKLDPILSAAQSSGAIDSYTIQCDENNNTEDIISADYGVVDITVVMNHGMEKIINRITLKRNSVSQ